MAISASSIREDDEIKVEFDRGSDLRRQVTDDPEALTFRTKRRLSKKVIIPILILVFLIILVLVIVYAFSSGSMTPEDFAAKLSEHMENNYPDIDKNLKQAYKMEINDYYRKGYLSQDYQLEADSRVEYAEFVKTYDKERKGEEHLIRYFIFRNKYMEIKNQAGKIKIKKINYNLGEKSYIRGITKFSDRTIDERSHMLSGVIPIKNKHAQVSEESVLLVNQHLWDPKYLSKLKKAKNMKVDIKDPSEVTGEDLDWRRAEVVTHVKDQKEDCGSCWAFASVASVESIYKLLKDKNLDLSEQYMIDCEDRCMGCQGGYVDYALDFFKNRGVPETKIVPYSGSNGRCPHIEKTKYFIDQFTVMNGKDILNKSLVLSPTVVNIGASDRLFDYKGGIYDDECSVSLNHSVLLVGEGYDEVLKKRYWILKNSWGENWGENGYFRLERTDEGFDKCGILTAGLNPYLNHKVSNEHLGNLWF